VGRTIGSPTSHLLFAHHEALPVNGVLQILDFGSLRPAPRPWRVLHIGETDCVAGVTERFGVPGQGVRILCRAGAAFGCGPRRRRPTALTQSRGLRSAAPPSGIRL
jgi:hypothetical protein